MEAIEKIRKLGEQYNSSLNRIGQMLDDLAGDIDYTLPDSLGNVEFEHGNVAFTNTYPCSNIGCIGSCFWYVDDGVHALASTTRTPGEGFYLHGDYNCWVKVASRYERREVARQMPEFLRHFAEWLEKAATQTATEEENLRKLVEKMKNV